VIVTPLLPLLRYCVIAGIVWCSQNFRIYSQKPMAAHASAVVTIESNRMKEGVFSGQILADLSEKVSPVAHGTSVNCQPEVESKDNAKQDRCSYEPSHGIGLGSNQSRYDYRASKEKGRRRQNKVRYDPILKRETR
jgi:hypothetical protein